MKMQEVRSFLWLSRNVAGASGPRHLYGNRLHSPLCARGAAQSERGHGGKRRLLKSQVPQQGTGNKNMLQNNTSVHGETEALSCMTEINQSQKSATEFGDSRIKSSPG